MVTSATPSRRKKLPRYRRLARQYNRVPHPPMRQCGQCQANAASQQRRAKRNGLKLLNRNPGGQADEYRNQGFPESQWSIVRSREDNSHQIRRMRQSSKMRSLLTIGRFSACAWAISSRSKRSLYEPGNR